MGDAACAVGHVCSRCGRAGMNGAQHAPVVERIARAGTQLCQSGKQAASAVSVAAVSCCRCHRLGHSSVADARERPPSPGPHPIAPHAMLLRLGSTSASSTSSLRPMW